MLSVSFACVKSKQNKSGQSPIQLWVIEKNLTTHLARHTAATLMLNSGISIDIVAKILGHSNTRMTQHYAKMLDKTIIHTKIEL